MKPVMAFDNFNVAAFNKAGKQIPILQKNLLCLWAEHAEREGFNPDGVVVETPRGNWRLFRRKNGRYGRYGLESAGRVSA